MAGDPLGRIVGQRKGCHCVSSQVQSPELFSRVFLLVRLLVPEHQGHRRLSPQEFAVSGGAVTLCDPFSLGSTSGAELGRFTEF